MQYFEQGLAIITLLILISIFASKTAGRAGVPVMLFFLIVGMLAGSEGLGGIQFDNHVLAQMIGNVSLIYILFSGGFDSDIKNTKPVMKSASILATFGVVITAGLVGLFVHYLLGLPLVTALLLGSIVSSTDAAAVFGVLRSKGIGLKGRLKALLESESASNDPMAVLLTVNIITFINGSVGSPSELALGFAKQVIIGAAFGYGFGKITAKVVNKINLDFEGLYPVLTFSAVGLCYGITQLLGGNGILSVYLMGLTMAATKLAHKRSLMTFHDGIGWLSQIVMFVCLGLLVFPTQIPSYLFSGLAISFFMMLVARPISVFICLIGQKYNVREKLFVSWVGLRGSVPIILATYPLVANVEGAHDIFNVVFFIVVLSVALQGTTIQATAKLFKVDDPNKPRERYPIEFNPSPMSKNDMVEVDVPPYSSYVGKSIVELHIPQNTLIVLMQRKGETFVPHGRTVIEANDSMLVLANKERIKELKERIRARGGEIETG